MFDLFWIGQYQQALVSLPIFQHWDYDWQIRCAQVSLGQMRSAWWWSRLRRACRSPWVSSRTAGLSQQTCELTCYTHATYMLHTLCSISKIRYSQDILLYTVDILSPFGSIWIHLAVSTIDDEIKLLLCCVNPGPGAHKFQCCLWAACALGSGERKNSKPEQRESSIEFCSTMKFGVWGVLLGRFLVDICSTTLVLCHAEDVEIPSANLRTPYMYDSAQERWAWRLRNSYGWVLGVPPFLAASCCVSKSRLAMDSYG